MLNVFRKNLDLVQFFTPLSLSSPNTVAYVSRPKHENENVI